MLIAQAHIQPLLKGIFPTNVWQFLNGCVMPIMRTLLHHKLYLRLSVGLQMDVKQVTNKKIAQ